MHATCKRTKNVMYVGCGIKHCPMQDLERRRDEVVKALQVRYEVYSFVTYVVSDQRSHMYTVTSTDTMSQDVFIHMCCLVWYKPATEYSTVCTGTGIGSSGQTNLIFCCLDQLTSESVGLKRKTKLLLASYQHTMPYSSRNNLHWK